MDFFDRVGRSVSNAGASVLGKVSDVSSAAGLAGDVSRKEREIKELYAKLGEQICNEKRDVAKGVSGEVVDKLDSLLIEYKLLKQHLNAAKHVITCAECGAENPDTGKFCQKCGKPLPQRFVSPVEGEILCQKCGNRIVPGTRFCNKCGTPVPIEDPMPVVAEPEPDLPVIDISEDKSPNTIFCTECGAKVEEGTLFCTSCGASLK